MLNLKNLALGAALMSMTAAIPARAQDHDGTSLAAFVSVVDIPGKVFPGSGYIFGLADPDPSRPVVRKQDPGARMVLATRISMPTYSESRRYNESIRFQQPVSPDRPLDRPAAKTWLGSHTGNGFLYLTNDHQKFFVPVEQPPTSLPEWFDKTLPK